MSRVAFFAIAGLLFAPLAASAQTAPMVAQARVQGLVGERYDGYLGVVGDADATLRHRVSAINIRRRALYSDLAERRGVSLQEVGMTAACQLFATIGVGEQYLASDKVWRVRARGQEALIPDYCR